MGVMEPQMATEVVTALMPSVTIGLPWMSPSVSDAFVVAARLTGADGQILSTSGLARALEIPLFRVERAARALANVGVAESLRGRKGGYRCLRPAREISAKDVFTAGLRGREALLGSGGFASLDAIMDEWMRQHSLADLLQVM
jgi:hypothetical protein